MRMRCPICFEYFTPNSNSQKFCGAECRMFAKKKEEEKKAQQKKKSKKIKSIRQINREARERGMTYGQYVAYMEANNGK